MLLLLPAGCVDGGGEGEGGVKMLSFELAAGDNDVLERSVQFTINHSAGTITGSYVPSATTAMPPYLNATFTFDGVRVRLGNGRTVPSGAAMAFGAPFSLTVISPDGKSNKDYTVSLAWGNPNLDSRSAMLGFSIPRSENPALESDIAFERFVRTYTGKYLRWIDGARPDMLVPVFELESDLARVLVGGQPVVSGQTAVSFADDVEFTVVAEDGVHTSTYTISLICPQINTELPVLHFSDIDASAITGKDSESAYVSTRLQMYSNTSAQGRWELGDDAVQIRGRGNSTWSLPKKPYRLRFPKKHSPPGMTHASARSWTLLAHDMDKSLIRNHLAFGLARILFDRVEGWHDPAAVMFTPASQHVNIYFNGAYHGLYQMSDQMQQGAGRLEIDELIASDGTSKTGGYMLEATFTEEAPNFHTNKRNYSVNMKYPDDDNYTESQRVWIDTFVGNAEDALYDSGWLDKNTGWRQWWDERTWADFIIVKELVGDMDGYTCTYFYKRDGVEKLFFGPIWDCDKGFANDKRRPNGNNPATSLMIKAGFQMQATHSVQNDWFNRVWDDSDFRAFVSARWQSKRGELVSYVLDEIDALKVAMPKSVSANFEKWPWMYQANSGEAPLPKENYDAELRFMKDWIESRATILDIEFAK